MGEGYIQKTIIDYLKGLPKCVMINIVGHPNQEKGIADILVCYRGMYIALEVKQHYGELRSLQRLFLRRVRRAEGIGEIVYDIEIVKRIIGCIDAGRTWTPVSDLGLKAA
jgi:hypothetical protein